MEIDDAMNLLTETESDLVIIGPSVASADRRKLRNHRRIVSLTRNLPDAASEKLSSAPEAIRIPGSLDRLQEIIDDIVKERLREITGSPAYLLNRRMSGLIGTSSQIRVVKEQIVRYGPAPGPVLITGESGTGKDIIARMLHDFSGQSEGPFHAVNAGAIPRELSASELFGAMPGAYTGAVRRSGFFEYADGGSLFLDEIGELETVVQTELLRVLETGSIRRVGSNRNLPVDVRLLSATNAELSAAVDAGRFRADLLYRIDMFRIHAPALRERIEDIPDLLMHFSKQLRLERPNRHWEFSDSFLDRLFEYNWPGNVRELRNVFRRAVYSSDSELLTGDSIRYD
ncbi:MAG TPA: Fis family transcriptional regulator [Spirochaeta sp.]|nr:Fis family transcriptional regulator [Spirochaeta sp.]